MKEKSASDDPAMVRILALWEEANSSGMTQEALGIEMGYDQKSARKSVSQFLKTKDPRISMLRKFAKAIGVKLSQIIDGGDE